MDVTQLDRNGRRTYTTGTGQSLTNLHSRKACAGEPCVLHNQSAHSMLAFPTHWRRDRQLMERICPHGVGHPDPDAWMFSLGADSVHGCDGCCSARFSR